MYKKRRSLANSKAESIRPTPLTYFHIGLEGDYCRQDDPACLWHQGLLHVPQQLKRLVQTVQQVKTADDIILEAGFLPLVYS